MKLALVAAMAKHRVIGKDGKMPWHLPAELQHFKRITLGKPVLMGRTTYQSIGRPLPGRLNIVLSRQVAQTYTDSRGVVWVADIAAAMAAAAPAEQLMVIGGGQVYAELLPLAAELFITDIELDTAGDTYFPDYHASAQWQLLSEQQHPADASNPHAFTTRHYQRRA